MSTQISYIKNSSELVKKLKKVEISSNSIISSFDIVSMSTSIDVKAAEILLERKILRNLDLISGETVLEVGVIMNLVRLCKMFSYFFQFRGGFVIAEQNLGVCSLIMTGNKFFFLSFKTFIGVMKHCLSFSSPLFLPLSFSAVFSSNAAFWDNVYACFLFF